MEGTTDITPIRKNHDIFDIITQQDII